MSSENAKQNTVILNLGSGYLPVTHAINVDVVNYEGVDIVENLLSFPWRWDTGTIDGIYMSHFLEHVFEHEKVLKECHRILKKGGFLDIVVPHSSSFSLHGVIGHYRTYNGTTFDDYLSRPFYMFKEPLFKTQIQQVRWFYDVKTLEETKKRLNIELSPVMYYVIKAIDYVLTRLINLSIPIFENSWCYWVGGAREVHWRGIKI